MTYPEFEKWLKDSDRVPLVMGVLNVTPDSFSDGGKFATPSAAVARAHEMISQGATLIDIGGESTRPGAARISAQEQIQRIIPVIEQLKNCGALLSVDTTRAAVARAAINAGAHLINDISGGLDDPGMLKCAAELSVPIVLMHTRGQPANMQTMTDYVDVTAEVIDHLAGRKQAAIEAGIAAHRVLLDPGIGFAKTMGHNLILLKRLQEFKRLNQPLLLGTSRKSFIGKITGEDEPSRRLFGTAATISWCVTNGAAIVRVHDVAEMVKVVGMSQAIACSNEFNT